CVQPLSQNDLLLVASAESRDKNSSGGPNVEPGNVLAHQPLFFLVVYKQGIRKLLKDRECKIFPDVQHVNQAEDLSVFGNECDPLCDGGRRRSEVGGSTQNPDLAALRLG